MKPSACRVILKHAYDSDRGELNRRCGIEWADMNLAFERGNPLTLRFGLGQDELGSSIDRVRGLIFVATRLQLDFRVEVEDASGATSEVSRDRLEEILSTLGTSEAKAPTFERGGTDITEELLHLVERHGLSRWRDDIAALMRPFLEISEQPRAVPDREIPVGGSKLFGLPDLPHSLAWPTQGDCSAIWLPDAGLDPARPCGFMGQFRLSDLTGTRSSLLLPPSGLISFFAFAEAERVGTADGLILWFREDEALSRREAPRELAESNRTGLSAPLQLVERPSLPETDGPHFEALREKGIDEDAYERLLEDLEPGGRGLLGYGFTSTAGDPTPSAEWHQFARLETHSGVTMDFQMKPADLMKGRFERAQLVYVHLD